LFEKIYVLLELRRGAFARKIGSDNDVVVAEFFACRLGFGSDDGVNSANFVANLPTYLEQELGANLVLFIEILFCLYINFRFSAAKLVLLD